MTDKNTLSFCLNDLFTTERISITWNKLRKELRRACIRDCLDWLDWINTIDSSLPIIVDSVVSGSYRPKEPTRFQFAKGKGAYRELVMPNIIDALVFRHIADYLYSNSLTDEIKGAYFSKLREKTAIGNKFEFDDSNYEDFFIIWKHYNEYKTKTLLNDVYRVLVVTDISNYFDSISHQLLLEHLSPYISSRKIAGLLLLLLDSLKPSLVHTVNPGIGIPVDDLECSRQLAHIFLYEHDKRIIEEFGSNHYVRWMDDQNIGAKNLTDARIIVNFLTSSLSSQRLTLNSGKTKFLSPKELALEFHLEINDELTSWEDKWKDGMNYVFSPNSNDQKLARNELLDIFKAYRNKDVGHWGKVLKRFLGHSVAVNTSYFDKYLGKWLILYPADLGQRIFESLAKRNEVKKLLHLFETYCMVDESLYENIEAVFFNSLLLVNVKSGNEVLIKALCRKYLGGILPNTGKPLGKSTSILVLYWFSEDLELLQAITERWYYPSLSKEVARALIAVTAANHLTNDDLSNCLLRFNTHISEDVGKLSQFIISLQNGQQISFKSFANRKPRWPKEGFYYDPRAWLGLEILSHSSLVSRSRWFERQLLSFGKYIHTTQEKRVYERITKRLAAFREQAHDHRHHE